MSFPRTQRAGKAGEEMGALPKDPVMLLSFVNMKLRDFYPGMEEFCKEFSVTKEEIDGKLSAIGYEYDRETNQYR